MGSLERRLEELKCAGRRPAPPPPAPHPRARTLSEVVAGTEARCGGGSYWKLAVPFEQVCDTHTIRAEAFAKPLQCEVRRDEFAVLDPTRTLVMDIETGGFSGTPVFLIGVVALDQWPLRAEQWLARDYPEEEAILQRLARWARKRPIWITFNGKAFDLPFLLDRATLYGVKMPPPRVHVDLLHAARRRWPGELPDYRLETLERHVLGRTRVGDVPGCDVPDLFHHFIHTRNAAPLKPVLEHNQLDLVTSTELLVRLSQRDEPD
ncbi:MAG: ribonuclease H-like domain-containing protein [Phycisphaerae bacterium]